MEATSGYHARYDANGVWLKKYNAIGNTALTYNLSWSDFAEKVCDVIEAERLFAKEDAEYNAAFARRMAELGLQNTDDG